MSTVDYDMGDHERLTGALVAHWPKAQRLLVDSPAFRHSVNELARMLPAMIAGLAAECQATDRMMAERIEVAKRLTPPPIAVRGDGSVVLAGPTVAERAAEMICAGSYSDMAWGIDEGSVECPECGITLFPEGDAPVVPAHPAVPAP
jgi:hypothetical protein